MTIFITDRDELLDENLRQLAERRLLFALSRFASRVERIDLVVSDENGPRGGIDKACRLSVVLHRASDVIISDRDSDIEKCISRVAERAGRSVSRNIAKQNDFRRPRSVFIEPNPAL